MKAIVTYCMLLLSATCILAQGVPNPSFELWDIRTMESPDGWFNSNTYAQLLFGQSNVTRVTDAHSGQYAVRMETFSNGVDTLFGYISHAPEDPNLGIGGVPYSQQPSTISGWAKYDIAVGDTGLIFIIFKNGGTVSSSFAGTFVGSSPVYTQFTFPVAPLMAPDTVIIAVASSLPNNGHATAGSWLQVDQLSFNTSDPIPYGDFEVWSTTQRMDPSGWSSVDMYGDTAEVVTRSTDAITGQYAARIETKVLFGGQDTLGYMTTGSMGGNGLPYTLTTDTLCGYYKYQGVSGDSGIIGAVFFQSGNLFYVAPLFIHDASTYTYFEIPFQVPMTPDSVRIDLWSSDPNGIPHAGSFLLIDSLRFKSDPLVGLAAPKAAFAWTVYPNPMHGYCWLEVATEVTGVGQLSLHDLQGRRVHAEDVNLMAGLNRLQLGVDGLVAGTYLATLVVEGQRQCLRIVIQ